MEKIIDIAAKLAIPVEQLELYGHYKAKINPDYLSKLQSKKKGKLILVTAITPTKAGEGKTTSTIAILDGMRRLGYDALACLREPSLGPVFGMKGGATGGGLAKIVPEEEINLHFTGDIHALTSAVNLIAAIIDNHIFQGNQLGINPDNIVWKRALDMNDRALRKVTVGLGVGNGTAHENGFLITVASELMAILCLATDADDFQERIQKIIVAYTFENKPVTVGDLRISHAIMKLMREALKPNIVQTLEANPVLIHGGPFANIAHGCNSIIALKAGVKLADYVLTEAGFGADLGAEKFFDICMRTAQMKPDAAVVVATIRALKMHGGASLDALDKPDVNALLAGVSNLQTHIENIKKFGVPPVVAINHFASDDDAEVEALRLWCQNHGYPVGFLDSFIKGSAGAEEMVKVLVDVLENKTSSFAPIYRLDQTIERKIEAIAREVYRADGVELTPKALEQIKTYEGLGFSNLPICMAKTQYSFSDNPDLLGAPRGFKVTIREINISAGAGFLVAMTGDVMIMPGLGALPSAVKMEDAPY